jgi:hypothetical protein
MNFLLIFLFIPLLSNFAFAYDSWDNTDKYLLALTLVSITADSVTTHESLKHEDTYETNPLLGEHPSDRKLVLFSFANMVTVTIVAHLFPTYYRKWFLGIVTGIKFGSAYWNYRMELRY